eukprot:1999267-Prymnesium_polylepis.1
MPVFHGFIARQDLLVDGRAFQCASVGDFSPLPRGCPACGQCRCAGAPPSPTVVVAPAGAG